LEGGESCIRIWHHLHAAVSADKIGRLTKTENSLYEIMKSLKKDYCMSDESRLNDVLKHYGDLKRFPRD
jgi:hypothetical protein